MSMLVLGAEAAKLRLRACCLTALGRHTLNLDSERWSNRRTSVAGFALGWTSLAADYSVQLPEDMATWKVFWST